MKRVVLHRFLPALLGVAMTLGLAACGADEPPSLEMESTGLEELFSAGKTVPGEDREITDASSGDPGPDGAADTPSGGQADPEDVPAPAADPEPAQESLTLLYEIMAWDDGFSGAVAYLGYREQGDPTPLPDWMRENCPGLVEEAPFLLEIPAERILGTGCQMWGERTPTRERIWYQTLPRLAAYAECGWTSAERKDLGDFRRRVAPLQQLWREKGYIVSQPVY